MKKYSLDDIVPFITVPYNIAGNSCGKYFLYPRPIFQADEQSLVFVSPDRQDKQALVEQSASCMIICDDSVLLKESILASKCFIVVENPKLLMAKIVNGLFQKKPTWGFHSTAFINPEACVHPNAYVGPYSYVGKCTIDEGVVIDGHCHLYDNVIIGKNVTIHAGCVIGVEGFGYIKDENGENINIPHLGGVIIEDDVALHSFVNVDGGTFAATVVGRGTKIDKYCHIGHNVVIGRDYLICAGAILSGSAVIGDDVFISPSVTVRDGGVRIGSRAFVGLGSLVTKDVPPGLRVMGVPARPIEEYKKMLSNLKRCEKDD
jgi:UDP-3-O-[3-hydroxymyristoyl] glucosamine N-acyltransferase